ncbi:hypothetical protein OHR68_31160 [Spirillospora sp. NBC_00431]
MAVGGAVVLAAAAMVIGAVRVSGDDGQKGTFTLLDANLAVPKAVADRVPAGDIKFDVCALSAETARELVVEKQNSGSGCYWEGSDTRPGFRSNLYVKLNRFQDDLADLPFEMETAYAEKQDPPKVVSGLGDQAVVHYRDREDDSEAAVAFRWNGLEMVVIYRAFDYDPSTGKKPRPESEVTKNAIKAARELVARQKVRPYTVPLSPTPPITTVPERACDEALHRTLAKGSGERPPYRTPSHVERVPLGDGIRGVRTAACRLPTGHGDDAKATVRIDLVPDWKPGAGTQAATRRYLDLHRMARDGSGGTSTDLKITGYAREPQKPFQAVAGLGDQAFATTATGSRSVDGRVVLRIRNVLVEARYGEGDPPGEAPRDKLVQAAYTLAAEMAKRLQSS